MHALVVIFCVFVPGTAGIYRALILIFFVLIWTPHDLDIDTAILLLLLVLLVVVLVVVVLVVMLVLSLMASVIIGSVSRGRDDLPPFSSQCIFRLPSVCNNRADGLLVHTHHLQIVHSSFPYISSTYHLQIICIQVIRRSSTDNAQLIFIHIVYISSTDHLHTSNPQNMYRSSTYR